MDSLKDLFPCSSSSSSSKVQTFNVILGRADLIHGSTSRTSISLSVEGH